MGYPFCGFINFVLCLWNQYFVSMYPQ